jgi:hypothetical protein
MPPCSGCKTKPGTMACSACRVAWYCDWKCQKLHWNNGGHKKVCCAVAKQNIHASCSRGQADVLAGILSLNPNIGMDWENHDGGTAAGMAAQGGHHKCLQLLSGRGANLNKQNNYGYGPIHIVCRNGDLDTLRVLLELGASPFIPTGGHESVAETPAKLCLVFGHTECLALLYSSGVLPDTLNRYGQNHLHLAAFHGSDKAIQLGYSRGGNINLLDHRGHTPLDIAVAMAAKTQSPASLSCVALIRRLGGEEILRPAGTKTIVMSTFGNVLSSQETTLVCMLCMYVCYVVCYFVCYVCMYLCIYASMFF